MVDGTKIRLQGPRGVNLGRADMRWALASVEENKPFEPVGFWVKKCWKKIKEDLENHLNCKRLEVLFSDGEPGIEEVLLEEGMRHQRCVLHGKRDLSYILYLDGLKKTEQAPLMKKIVAIPAFQLNKEKLEKLSPEDLPKIKALAEKNTKGISGND